ncbi:MAG: helix-turn-helix domain-containing protein [Candidatus Sulfotelmatobacter sp.]
MPRRPDPDLEALILKAAQKLWRQGGEKALTMRAVAKAARTNTPSVYRRFRTREDILRALLLRIRLELAARLESAATPEEGCERFLEFAVTHSHEYLLLHQRDYELFHSPRAIRAGAKPGGWPSREAMRRKLLARLGPVPDNHEDLLMALWMVLHGTAMLLIEKKIGPKEAAEARRVCTALVARLLQPQPPTS